MANKLTGYELIGYFNAFETQLMTLPPKGVGSKAQNREVQSAADTLRKIEQVDFSEVEKGDQAQFLKQIKSVKTYLLSETGKDVFKQSFLGLSGAQAAKSSVEQMLAHIDTLCAPLDRKEVDLNEQSELIKRLRTACNPSDAEAAIQKFHPYRKDQKFLMVAARVLAKKFPEVLINNLALFPLKKSNDIFLLGALLKGNHQNLLAKHYGYALEKLAYESDQFVKGLPKRVQAIMGEGICFGVCMSLSSPVAEKRNLATARFLQALHDLQFDLPASVQKSLKIEKPHSMTHRWKPFTQIPETLEELKRKGGQFKIAIRNKETRKTHAAYFNVDTASYCDPFEISFSEYHPFLKKFKDADELIYEFRRHLKFVLSEHWDEASSEFSVMHVPVSPT